MHNVHEFFSFLVTKMMVLIKALNVVSPAPSLCSEPKGSWESEQPYGGRSPWQKVKQMYPPRSSLKMNSCSLMNLYIFNAWEI